MARLFDNNTANYMSRASVNLGLNGLTECSIGMWIKLTSVVVATHQVILAKELVTNYWSPIFSYVLTNTSQIGFEVENRTANQYPDWSLSSGLGFGSWNRVLFTWSRTAGAASTDAVIYVNGVATTTSFTANGYTNTFTIEEVSSTMNYGIEPAVFTTPLNAALAWVCVWNRQLTVTEALQDYVNPKNVMRGMMSCVELNPILTSDRDIGSIAGSMTVNGTLGDAPDPPIVSPPTGIVVPFRMWG